MYKLLKIFRFFCTANVLKTIVFNFRMLPFKQAICLPIHLYGDIIIDENKKGKVVFHSTMKPSFGSWRIGNNRGSMYGKGNHPYSSRLAIFGQLLLGRNGEISNGVNLVVKRNASLCIGDRVYIAPKAKIYCEQNIFIGDNTSCSWEMQIMDSDFHYLQNEKGVVCKKSKPIHVGANCWIGNRVTINKGTYLNDDSVVASNSLVNKDFSNIEGGTFGGIPAKVLTTGCRRVFDYKLERKIDEYFRSHSELDSVNVDLL